MKIDAGTDLPVASAYDMERLPSDEWLREGI